MSHPSAAAARKKHTHACCAVTQKARVSFIKAYASKPARQTAVRETPLSAEVRRRVSMGLLEKGIHINSRLNPAHDFFFNLRPHARYRPPKRKTQNYTCPWLTIPTRIYLDAMFSVVEEEGRADRILTST